MKRVISLLCLFACIGFVEPCYAQGVIAYERVINLPQDQGKWYVSVVGDENDKRYNEILSWFDTDERAKKLKDQVHFLKVTSNSAVYAERYAGNTKSLPMVRMQSPDGKVVYEACGNDIPMSPGGLTGAIAESIRPLLPWRRDIEDQIKDRPSPPVIPEPPVTPPDCGPPILDDPAPLGQQKCPMNVLVVALVISIVVGVTTGLVAAWKKTYKVS